jgi:hypothetical protein
MKKKQFFSKTKTLMFLFGMAALALTFVFPLGGCAGGPMPISFGSSVPEEERVQLLVSPSIIMQKVDGNLVIWNSWKDYATTVNMPAGSHAFDFRYQRTDGSVIYHVSGLHKASRCPVD